MAIVGAGPAGATTAARLASQGFSVTLIDKSTFPRDKPCGGGLSPKAYRGLEPDISDLVLARPRRVRLSAAGVGPVVLESAVGEIWMVRRAAFDLRLVEDACQRGARLREGIAVRGISGRAEGGWITVVTDAGPLQARVVVAADGADSTVARSAGLRLQRERSYLLALEAEGVALADGPGDLALIDFSIPAGYAWLFPKGTGYNVGVGTSDRRRFRHLRAQLAHFLARHHLTTAEPPRTVGHKIPVWRGVEPLHRGPVILVGDAAGVADPLFGEGIAYAIQTGRFASDAVARYLSGEWADLSGYTLAVQGLLGSDLRFWSLLGQLIYRAPRWAVRLLSSHRTLQRLADDAISGDRSVSKIWRR